MVSNEMKHLEQSVYGRLMEQLETQEHYQYIAQHCSKVCPTKELIANTNHQMASFVNLYERRFPNRNTPGLCLEALFEFIC